MICVKLSNIDSAIRQVKNYKKDLEEKAETLIKLLVDEGVKIAKMQLSDLGINFTGELDASITGYYSPSLKTGIIKTDKWYAMFVEFGTGVVGERSPHPEPNDWEYDINRHGDKGWVYFDDYDKSWKRTAGFKSRPFMYNTAKELEGKVTEIARRVFK